ncbi:MAG: hypothetical protein M0Q49_04540 [Porticoccaceae bacterium]|nr:hypothetical protein [Porticoccaceae bacterium]
MAEFWLPAKPGVLTAIRILAPNQAPVLVSDEMPKTRPAQVVLVSQVGGSRPNPVQSIHRLLIECWLAKSSAVNIETWCGEVSAALRNSSGRTYNGVFSFGWGNEQGPVDFPDPDVTDMRRWQFHGDLKLSAK